jgi:pyruvate/2-oxoglutarate dehydrogenase complex dihydrolipoamide dehydrogenase (E3) component
MGKGQEKICFARELAMTDRELVIDCPRCGHCCPQRPWVGLTKEEAKEISLANRPYVIDMIAALEARLKEKNT